MSKNLPTLKPCPFCGSAAEYHSQTFKKYPLQKDSPTTTYWAVFCTNNNCRCAATYDRDDTTNFLVETQEKAAAAWNKRS
jgi:hypothetical protein